MMLYWFWQVSQSLKMTSIQKINWISDKVVCVF